MDACMNLTCTVTGGFLPFLPTWKEGLTGAAGGERVRWCLRRVWVASTDSLVW